MANHHSIPPSDDAEDRIVEAAPDPQVERIADLTERSANDAAFAELEADFAEQQHQYADQLAEEGRKDDADAYAHDAIAHLKDAKRVMGQAREEESEAERLRRQRQGDSRPISSPCPISNSLPCAAPFNRCESRWKNSRHATCRLCGGWRLSVILRLIRSRSRAGARR